VKVKVLRAKVITSVIIKALKTQEPFGQVGAIYD
jgi:hypothetical protein